MPVQYRNVRVPPETLGVQYGVLGKRIVGPDGLITVTDAAAPAYDRQPLIWKREGSGGPNLPPVQPSAPEPAVVKTEPEVPAAATEPVLVTPEPAAEVVIETGVTSHTDAEPVSVQTEQASEPAPVQETSATEAQEALLDKEIAELEAERAALAQTEEG